MKITIAYDIFRFEQIIIVHFQYFYRILNASNVCIFEISYFMASGYLHMCMLRFVPAWFRGGGSQFMFYGIFNYNG